MTTLRLKIENMVKNDMARETNGKAGIFHQSGYNWISNQLSNREYLSPSEYLEIVTTMNFLSN